MNGAKMAKVKIASGDALADTLDDSAPLETLQRGGIAKALLVDED